MDLSKEILDIIETTPRIPEEVKKSLHMKIMRKIEQMKSTPVGKKHGVTIMTEEASLAGDKTARNRNVSGDMGDAKPKSL